MTPQQRREQRGEQAHQRQQDRQEATHQRRLGAIPAGKDAPAPTEMEDQGKATNVPTTFRNLPASQFPDIPEPPAEES